MVLPGWLSYCLSGREFWRLQMSSRTLVGGQSFSVTQNTIINEQSPYIPMGQTIVITCLYCCFFQPHTILFLRQLCLLLNGHAILASSSLIESQVVSFKSSIFYQELQEYSEEMPAFCPPVSFILFLPPVSLVLEGHFFIFFL